MKENIEIYVGKQNISDTFSFKRDKTKDSVTKYNKQHNILSPLVSKETAPDFYDAGISIWLGI